MTAIAPRPGGPATTQPAGPKQPLSSVLFPDEGNTFAVLDAASAPELLDKLYEHEAEFECLHEGDVEPDVAEVAPYLVKLEREGPFTEWLLQRGWGNHYGIFVLTADGFRDVLQHLRRFVKVHSEAGKPMLFRFYDPRVLRVYLPTCNPGEVAEFFGTAQAFVAEAEDKGSALKMENAGAKLKVTSIPLKEG